jgi:hypothetical protein
MDVLIPSYILYRILYTSAVSRNQIISNDLDSMMPSAYHCMYIWLRMSNQIHSQDNFPYLPLTKNEYIN